MKPRRGAPATAAASATPADLVVPRSVAIIMDGNGRWAQQAGLERIRGHERGVEAVRDVVTECARLRVEALWLYAFSEENWARPAREVALLMRLLRRFLVGERPTLMQNDVRLVHAGRRRRLPEEVLAELDETIAMTSQNRGLALCLAISYGSRQELTDAVAAIAGEVARGELAPGAIDEGVIGSRLYRPELPDPDLLIRTAGELRVSNFLLWQISYAEIHVTDVCWPDFRKENLHAAFRDFGQRQRKFGRVVT
jgi:undecaprenyl diphosphate synthase